jgi:O-acetyl-ADP-ribose deacetylase (regulator of RNase III)
MSENVTDFEQKINNINVCLKTGNVAAEDADCIVVPEFRDGASGGGVGYAIETAGMGAGLEAYEKVAQEGFLKDGDAIITESGKPDVKLAHVVTVGAREDSQFEVVNRSVLKTLETANEVGIKRIALPEIGTGIIGSLTQEQSAKAIFNAVYEFSKNNPSSSVEEVSFVVYRSSTEPAKRVLTDKSYIGIMTAEKGNKSLDLKEFVEGLGNHGVRKKAKSPTREEILNDKATREFGRNLVTKLFWAETREAVDAYIEAGIDINQKSRAENKTALDYCIERVIKGINTYEDSDNKGAVLQMALKGGKCSAESLEQLKAKDPEFCSKVIEVMKGREKLQDLGAEIVTDTKNPLSGHANYQASGHVSAETAQEMLERVREKVKNKFMPNSSETGSSQPYHIEPVAKGEAMEVKWDKIIKKEELALESINQPDNLVIAMGNEHKPLHEPDEFPPVPTHETLHRNNIMEKLKDKRERQDLLKDAVLISRRQGSEVISVDQLCKRVVEAAKTSPVKADDDGNIFVVRKGAKLDEALLAWKEQVGRPYLKEKFSPEFLAERLQDGSKKTRFDTTCDTYQEAANVEILVTEYPEHADKITMLQLANAVQKADTRNKEPYDKLKAALSNSAQKFIQGEETFPPTFENVVALQEARNVILLNAGTAVRQSDFDKRVAETELKVLKELEPEDIKGVSDKALAGGMVMAEKHRKAGNGDFGKIFTTELKRRLSQGNTFDPRS